MIRKIMLALLAAGLLAAPAAAKVAEVSYLKNGVYAGKVATYTLSGAVYLDASQAARVIGGKIYWYPVSGKLLLQIRGNKVVFFIKSDSVVINDEKASFPNPMIVRGGKAFLALDFFISKYFARAFGFRLDYNKATGALSAQQDVNVTSVNFFSYQDKTRIVVYLEEALEWQSTQRENNLLTVNIAGGVLGGEEKLSVGDGVVRGVDLTQENKTVKLVVNPDDNFGRAEVFKLPDPDRIVIDVFRSQGGGQPPPQGPAPAEVEVSTAAEAPELPRVIPPQPAAPPQIPDKIELDRAGRKRVVIDAGHGGKDPGGRKLFGLKEKEINLAVAKELLSLLKNEDIFEVVMTRADDTFVPLAERSAIANSYKADLFISIHANAHRNRREKGFEIFFMSEKASDPGAAEVADYENSVLGLESPSTQPDAAAMLLHSMARNEYLNEGSRLAALVAAEMEKRTPFASRGVKQAAFYVLRGTYSPGILVEVGFMTNANDQKNMNDKKVRAKVAGAIHKGVMKYAEMKDWK